MRRVSWILAVVCAVVLSACSSNGDDQDVSQTPPSASQHDAVVPELTPRARLASAVDEVHVAYAPDVPPPLDRSDQRVLDIGLEVLEGVCPLDPANDVSTEMWGYRVAGDAEVACGSPGPVLRGRVGDVVRITLTNGVENAHPHNIDFHAVTGQGGGAADLTVAPGETARIEVRLLYPGAFMYHCAFGDVPEHIAKGMYGMFIVDPETPLPAVDHEWAVMQSEWYVGSPDAAGLAPFDRSAVTSEEPRYVTFNGRTDALVGDGALSMSVGERARIYMVNEGLALDSNFHPIGSHWDTVYPEAATHPSNRVIRGSQSTLVVAGGGTVVELDARVPSTLVLVDHALARAFDKGAIGQIVISGDPEPEVFSALGQTEPASPSSGPSGEGVETTAVAITEGAFDPANAAQAYTPPSIKVVTGATVTWTNDDTLAHTVTSGSSDGARAAPDGFFDSGSMATGDTFDFTFSEPGTFAYYCIPHPWMIGEVVVE